MANTFHFSLAICPTVSTALNQQFPFFSYSDLTFGFHLPFFISSSVWFYLLFALFISPIFVLLFVLLSWNAEMNNTLSLNHLILKCYLSSVVKAPETLFSDSRPRRSARLAARRNLNTTQETGDGANHICMLSSKSNSRICSSAVCKCQPDNVEEGDNILCLSSAFNLWSSLCNWCQVPHQ